MNPGDKVRVRYQTARGTLREWSLVQFWNAHIVDLQYGPGTLPEQFDLRTGAGSKGPAKLWLIDSDDLQKLKQGNPHARFAARRGVRR